MSADDFQAVFQAWLELSAEFVSARYSLEHPPDVGPGYVWVCYSYFGEHMEPLNEVEHKMWVIQDGLGKLRSPPAIYRSHGAHKLWIPYPNSLITPFGYYEEVRTPGYPVWIKWSNYHMDVRAGKRTGYPFCHYGLQFKRYDLRRRRAPIERLTITRAERQMPVDEGRFITISVLYADFWLRSPLVNRVESLNPSIGYCYDPIAVEIDAYVSSPCVGVVGRRSTKRKSMADSSLRVLLPLPIDSSGHYMVTIRTRPVDEFIQGGIGRATHRRICLRYDAATRKHQLLPLCHYRRAALERAGEAKHGSQ